jgi:hypothetical protein
MVVALIKTETSKALIGGPILAKWRVRDSRWRIPQPENLLKFVTQHGHELCDAKMPVGVSSF